MRTSIFPTFLVLVLFCAVVSPNMSHAACNATALGRVALGDSNPAVRALQECLIDAGYPIPAGVTGYYGMQTRSAVTAFYATSLNMPAWDGLTVGPQGRASLAKVALGGKPSPIVTNTYKQAGNAETLAKYVSAPQPSYMMAGASMREVVAPTLAQTDKVENAQTASRVSETNVQVAGIDEPDIVKTDGANIFISQQEMRVWYDVMSAPAVSTQGVMPPFRRDTGKTTIVSAFPLSTLAKIGNGIPEHGDLLLVKDKKLLVVLTYSGIVGYDVSIPKTPIKKWTLSLENNTSVISARLSNGTLYLVTGTYLTQNMPCVIPLLKGTNVVSVSCADIWVPSRVEPVNQAYTVLAVNPQNGAVSRTQTFATDSGNTTVAMFADNLYIATKSYATPYDVLAGIVVDAYAPYLSATSISHMRTIQGYDISADGKLSEIQKVVDQELAQKTADERLRIQTEAENSAQKAVTARIREIDRTRLVRLDLATLALVATGEIPGTLLNQFALDEHQGTLRAAVTVGGTWLPSVGQSVSANDIYTLGLDLTEKGRITNLGTTERVYAARFVGNRGYLVTFRQTDPFYVLDLSVPTAPKLSGELKIPGYSAYLEPLDDNTVLGVGREGNGVKLSVFDVSNPATPVEKSKYRIADSWTEVESNHHAFLRDAAHTVFFMPGSNGGYVFSYANGVLSLKATVAGWSVKRAVYIDDYLYVIGSDKISVLDENTWKVAKELTLN